MTNVEEKQLKTQQSIDNTIWWNTAFTIFGGITNFIIAGATLWLALHK